jgi:hypothetical protein
MAETVIAAALRITDARIESLTSRSGQKVLQAIADVNMPQSIRQALLERLKAAGVLS